MPVSSWRIFFIFGNPKVNSQGLSQGHMLCQFRIKGLRRLSSSTERALQVYYLLILNTIFTAFSLGDLYDSFIREGNGPSKAPMLTAMALGGTLAFFSFRIYLLMYNIFIAGVVLLCSVITFVSAIMVPPYVQASGLVTEIDYKNRFVRTCTILCEDRFESRTSSAICGDVFVASSLVYFMVTHRTAVQSLRRILRELAQMKIDVYSHQRIFTASVATCIVTSLVQITETCFLFTVPQKGWFVISVLFGEEIRLPTHHWFCLLRHLYLQPIIIRICTASALAALNMRANWNKRLNVVHGCTVRILYRGSSRLITHVLTLQELSDFPSTSPDIRGRLRNVSRIHGRIITMTGGQNLTRGRSMATQRKATPEQPQTTCASSSKRLTLLHRICPGDTLAQ
ncbi:hypothetical protein FISHEDRAFT_61046 [Fistulina hepatica ATCC 64428]|uniref:Uncharacterized protein n=1 Tax=Fistulina hepatica ATCC 64428 TaxID=1128425 RepID=A0A0D7A3N2_9AGAR|nr:hypothetical protein FISHEDRAFT_61046 [Fistulina hepatica ATCC 64428]